LVVLVTLVAYRGSFSGALVFDDFSAIAENPTIRHLWPLDRVLFPPAEGGDTVGGRPLLNLSLALNYAISGTSVGSYHVFNLLVHLTAALVLFGLVRRTLLLPACREKFGAVALPLAASVAALWAVHPLQSESVAYLVQRAESMMGLFYLLTLYGFVRGAESARPWRWWGLAILACLCGMATKEVMITAPVLVFLYDRTFVAGNFRTAWRAHRGVHLALAATWILLGILITSTGGNRGGTKGFGLGFAWWEFPLTQFEAIAHYLRLAVWPHPLAFEYERFWVTSFAQVAPSALVVLPLALAALFALWRWPTWGFLGVWFFGILAPSSLAPGASQMIAEHRMYLPLAAVLVIVVLGLWRGLKAGGFGFAALFVAGAVLLTARRVEDYRSAVTLWTATVRERPLNGVAHGQLASALQAEGQLEPALAHFTEAIRLEQAAEPVCQRSLLAEITVNYGNVLLAAGRTDDAAEAYSAALRYDPNQKLAAFNLGSVRLEQGRLGEAEKNFRAALALAPDYAPAHTNLASLFLRQGRREEALAQYEKVLRLQPDSAKAEANLGNVLLQLRRVDEALRHLERAVQLQPDLAPAREFFGDALLQSGRRAEARREYEAAARLDPGNAFVRRKLATLAAP
jgi:tetratricopeptide (TPR) repeat protein